MNRYEQAFERFLRSARAPYLSNRQARRFQLGGGKTLKNFDFVVAGPNGANWIVDVKGRRFPGGLASPRYWKNWTTRDDLVGLLRWDEILGGGSAAYRDRSLFVFAYWVVGDKKPAPPERLFRWRGAEYAFFAVPVKMFLSEARHISPKWGTFEIPARRFREVAEDAAAFFRLR